MGPDSRDSPFFLLHGGGGSLQKEALIHESHKGKGMVTSSGGKSHLGAKERKKSLPHARASPSRLSKNISTTTEKASCHATDSSQTTIWCKERNQLCESHQQNRATDACTSAQRAPKLKKDPLVRKCYEAGQSNIPSVFKDPSWGDPSPAEDVLIQSFYCKQKGNFENKIGTHPDKAGPSSPLFQGSSAGAMFLDFESVRTMKEDPDEGSASDLSDSERIPIPPSPCTPPELNLRAEEIDPLCFEHLSDTKFKPSDYYYPDFLPPPFSTWDLKGLAVFVNTECTSEPRPQPTGFLEKYVDRLLELEWLQAQTIQAEKGKAAKARPQTAPSALRTLKSPGKNKPLHSPLPSKQLTPHESFPRIPTSHSSHRRDLYSEGNSQLVPSQTHFKAACGSSAHPKRPCEVRSEAKKQPATKQQLPSTQPSQSRSMIQGAGNIRPPKQSSFHDSAAPHKSLTIYTCTDPKKNGNTNNYLPSKKVLSDKKLKANGMKQAPCKFK